MSAYRDAMDDLLARDRQTFSPVGQMVDWTRDPSIPMPAALRGVLDDRFSRRHKAGIRLAQTLPAFLRLRMEEQREALRPERWRARIGNHFRRW